MNKDISNLEGHYAGFYVILPELCLWPVLQRAGWCTRLCSHSAEFRPSPRRGWAEGIRLLHTQAGPGCFPPLLPPALHPGWWEGLQNTTILHTHWVWLIRGVSTQSLDWTLLCTVSLISMLTVPAALAAVQVYRPESVGWTKVICREPELRTRCRTDSTNGWPSLCHVTKGGGEPSARHCSITEESTGAMYVWVSELITGGTAGQNNYKNYTQFVNSSNNCKNYMFISLPSHDRKLTLDFKFGLPQCSTSWVLSHTNVCASVPNWSLCNL